MKHDRLFVNLLFKKELLLPIFAETYHTYYFCVILAITVLLTLSFAIRFLRSLFIANKVSLSPIIAIKASESLAIALYRYQSLIVLQKLLRNEDGLFCNFLQFFARMYMNSQNEMTNSV